jgi:hypothetical protein
MLVRDVAYLKKMRGKRAWLHMVALVALMVGTIPVSALAALCHPVRCQMPCCNGFKAPKRIEPNCGPLPCHSCNSGGRSAKASPRAKTPSPCECKIKSKSDDSQEQRMLPATVDFKVSKVVADLPSVGAVVSFPAPTAVTPGVFATDSGPPESLASFPWLGRAPPVQLA